HGREQVETHTIQDEYSPGPRFSLVVGESVQRVKDRLEDSMSGAQPMPSKTYWLPFGQATFVPGKSDLFRAIAHRRFQSAFSFLLKPTEALQVAEPASLALGGHSSTYELDYEHRFSATSFAKLFFFHNDVKDYQLTPPVRQTVVRLLIQAPRVR